MKVFRILLEMLQLAKKITKLDSFGGSLMNLFEIIYLLKKKNLNKL